MSWHIHEVYTWWCWYILMSHSLCVWCMIGTYLVHGWCTRWWYSLRYRLVHGWCACWWHRLRYSLVHGWCTCWWYMLRYMLVHDWCTCLWYRFITGWGTSWCMVQVYWYMFTTIYLTVIVWQWFHQSYATLGRLDGARTGGCSHILVVTGEHRGL